MKRSRATVNRWIELKQRLFMRVPDYGVRRALAGLATVKYMLRLLTNDKVESLEFIAGLFALVFGLQILRPEYDFNAAYYGHLVSLAPREAWAFVMLFCGFDQILALLTATQWCRRVLAITTCSLWTFIAAVCWLTAPNNIAPGMYTIIAFMCGWSYVRLQRR